MTPAASSRPIAARTAAAVLLCLAWLLLPASPGHADDPVTLSRTGQLTDKVNALGDRKDAAADALADLDDARGIQLFVVYVRDFSGRSAQSWADTTADKNGLGLGDVLLAVATHDRQYAFSVDQDSRLTDAQIQDIAQTGVEPALRKNDWAGAAVGAANGIGAVVAGRPVPTPTITPGAADPGAGDSGGSGAGDLVLPVIAVGGAGAVVAYAYTRRKRRGSTGRPSGGGAQGWGKTPRTPQTPLPELDKQARLLLVETDDAVRTSTEELGFATAQFGEDAVKEFQTALASAQAELTAAFKLRQQLDDAFPEDDATKRRMLEEIISRCTGAGRGLDAQSADFDRLRALEQNAPEALAHAERAFRELAARTTGAQETMTALGGKYAASALQSVTGHVEQAKDRLVFATTQLNQARSNVDAGDAGKGAVHLRAAEGAVDQAGTFVTAIDRLAGELAEADEKLPAALTESATDLADARGLLEGTGQGVSTADLRGRIARVESVVGQVRAELAAGPYDPIDALRRVEEADTALDEALVAARERDAGTARARSLLGQALLAARSSTGAAADFITTHRGAVGSEARTRLAEAERRLGVAQAGQESDPAAALTEAQQADALARQAQSLAEQDVRGYGNPYGGGGGGGRGGSGMGGAVLGGIILGGLLNGGRGGGGGGFGGGGGGFGGAGGPGSFGGGGTRGRRGGGGRF
ncbi:TPM domain-containing protein [Streptomyces sp. NPDC059639]|uniref:TPM domain-containing protein n=1 Tax=Streptomyces sp. NPDC059639 TaxID=3346891 RepID=UPI0036A2637D